MCYTSRMNNKLLTIAGLSRETGLPILWLKKQVELKKIPFLNTGGGYRFNLQAVQRALNAIAKTGGSNDE